MEDEQLLWFIEMAAESAALDVDRSDLVVTDALREAVEEYEEALYKVLVQYAKSQRIDDPEEFAGMLFDEGDAPLNVFLTLNGEGAGIWDGRWEAYFSEKQIKDLQKKLKDNLSRFAEETGTGTLNEAILEAAYVSTIPAGGNGHSRVLANPRPPPPPPRRGRRDALRQLRRMAHDDTKRFDPYQPPQRYARPHHFAVNQPEPADVQVSPIGALFGFRPQHEEADVFIEEYLIIGDSFDPALGAYLARHDEATAAATALQDQGFSVHWPGGAL